LINPKKEKSNNIVSFSRDIFVSNKLSVIVSSILLIISGLLDAVGLSLIAPTVSLLIGESTSYANNSEIISNLKKVLDFFTIPYSLKYILGLIAIIMFFRSIFIFIQSFYLSIVQHSYTSELSKKYHNYLNSLSWQSFKEYKQAATINVFSESVRAGGSLKNYINLVSNFFVVLIYIAFLSIISIKMTAVSIILSVFIILIFYRLIKISNFLGKKQTYKVQQIFQDLSDSINLAKYLRTHGKTKFMTMKLFNSIDSYKKNQIKLGLNESIFQASYEYAFIGFLMLGLLIAARFFDLTSSTIALVTIILYRLFQRIKLFQQCFQSFNKTVPGYFSIKNEISKNHGNSDDWGNKRFNDIKNFIEFKDATFSIGKREIFSKLNYKFEKNKINVIIGKSGSGKTTLVDLITGLTELDQGHLKIDEQDIKVFSKSSYLNSIGYVDQNPYLFNDTILNNIKWGSKKNITKAKIYNLAKELKIHDLINNLPNGYDSNVGDFGNSLSGGERQRIVIARTLINNPRLLILDEATSQLDIKSQKIIMTFLKKLKKTTTIIMVTHRKETLEIADKVLKVN
tara:strand:- start:108 stop:1814 length:1707 start_codon:yes stop_codon:yes gene_type:complete